MPAALRCLLRFLGYSALSTKGADSVIRTMAIVGGLAFAACAGASKQTKEPKEQSQLICTFEPAIGSNIPDKVCREPEDEAEPAKKATTLPASGGQSGR